ncbi:Spore protein SP21 [Klebsiella pneumoniae]|nr:Spore protein SP21 [Klebsiella pneumoniae]
MDIDFKKLAPWNWFKNEQQEQQTVSSLPVQRNDLPAASGPVSPILQLHREIDRLFDDAFRGFGFPALNMPQWPSDWSGMLKPALDIQETDKQYKIALEVPGVEEKDIQITLDNDVLMVRGEKRQEQEKKEGGFHRVERSYGSFQRALNLPDDANQDSIKASFKNGVLTVTIDKREVSAPKQGRSIRSTATSPARSSQENRHETRSRFAMPRRLNLVNLVNLQEHQHGQKTMPGQPATVRVEVFNGRHSTMLLCDDHYRQLVRQQSAPFRRWKPCSAAQRPVRGPRQ